MYTLILIFAQKLNENLLIYFSSNLFHYLKNDSKYTWDYIAASGNTTVKMIEIDSSCRPAAIDVQHIHTHIK